MEIQKVKLNLKYVVIFFCLTILAFFLSSCKKKYSAVVSGKSKKTVIVYMVANNDLEYFADLNINEMESGWDSSYGNLIVYIERTQQASPPFPVVYKITHDTTSSIVSPIQWVYPVQNSCDPSVLSKVIADIKQNFPADTYSLIMWSHGSAWYPPGLDVQSSILDSTNSFRPSLPQGLPLTKSFGLDGANQMDIESLKNALPSGFDFILFDACYMGNIEVAYELKDKAQYIIASPTEVLSYGFPYNIIMPYIFANPANVDAIANEYVQSYQNQISPELQSASVAVINTSAFSDFTKLTNQAFTNVNTDTLYNDSTIQQDEVSQSNLLYDFVDVCNHTNMPDTMQNKITEGLNNLIVYKEATPQILNILTIQHFSGVSTYFPNKYNDTYYDYYKTLDWYKESGYSSFLDRVVIH